MDERLTQYGDYYYTDILNKFYRIPENRKSYEYRDLMQRVYAFMNGIVTPISDKLSCGIEHVKIDGVDYIKVTNAMFTERLTKKQVKEYQEMSLEEKKEFKNKIKEKYGIK